MKIAKLNLSTSGFSDADFLRKAEYVMTCLTGNTSFPSPVPPLADLSDAIEAFSQSLLGADAGNHGLVAAKNERRMELNAVYVQLGMYVMYIANGSVELLTQSGYPVSKEPEPIYISNPGNVTLVNGVTSGQLDASVAAVKGCKLYLFQLTESDPTEETVWDSHTCSRRKYSFKSLVPGKKYWVRVAATGSGNQITYSTIASQFVI